MMQDAFQALADPTRRSFLDQLADGPRPAGELVPAHPMSQPAVSRHLRVLREAGLVRVEAEGRHRVYHLVPDGLRAVADWVAHYERFWDDRLDALGRTLDDLARHEEDDDAP